MWCEEVGVEKWCRPISAELGPRRARRRRTRLSSPQPAQVKSSRPSPPHTAFTFIPVLHHPRHRHGYVHVPDSSDSPSSARASVSCGSKFQGCSADCPPCRDLHTIDTPGCPAPTDPTLIPPEQHASCAPVACPVFVFPLGLFAAAPNVCAIAARRHGRAHLQSLLPRCQRLPATLHGQAHHIYRAHTPMPSC